MAKKYYVIWKGEKTGVFDNWGTVQSLTAGRSDAQFMGFPSKAEAEAAFANSYTKALVQRAKTKAPSSGSYSTSKSANSSASKTSATMDAEIQIYSDGACSPNPGKSGTGIAIYEKGQLSGLWYGLYQANGTNNTAELNGLLEALKLAQHYLNNYPKVQVLSDSKYSIDCITKWASGWKKKGWKKANGEAIKNPELIQAAFALYESLKTKIIISHVKGHANIEGNELADRMAVHARKQQESSFTQFSQAIDIATILAMESG